MEEENIIESIKEIDYSDLIKIQIINCLMASKEDVMKIINTVAILEAMLTEEITKSDYTEQLGKIITELEKKFPAWRTNKEQYEAFNLELSRQKLAMLLLLVKNKTPIVIEIEDTGPEESTEKNEEVVVNTEKNEEVVVNE